jgi:hypothetical protein
MRYEGLVKANLRLLPESTSSTQPSNSRRPAVDGTADELITDLNPPNESDKIEHLAI